VSFLLKTSTPYRLKLATEPVDENDLFLYHKTTNRKLYDSMLHGKGDADDTVLYNSRGEVTETCIGNLVLKRGSALITPPLSSGLLPGVMREYLLRKETIREKVVKLKDLCNAEQIWVINSLRGWIKAELTDLSEKDKSSRRV